MRYASRNELEIPRGISTVEALQLCLDRAVAHLHVAMEKVDTLLIEDDAKIPEAYGGAVGGRMFAAHFVGEGGTLVYEPHPWYQVEAQCRQEVERLAGMMAKLGIADRMVKVEEAKATLMIQAIRDSAVAAGIPPDQVKALGAELRERVATMERRVEVVV
jgi:hypothetical protein